MENPPQSPLDYQSPGKPSGEGGTRPAGRFSIGLLIGSIFSAVVWPLWWLAPDQINQGNWGWLLVVVPALKVVATMVCLFYPRWRAFGGGLLASIGIGFLIFFGLCAANLSGLKI